MKLHAQHESPMSGFCRLRAAVSGDGRLLWEWANDPLVRQEAFNSEKIPWEEHAIWYAAKLADTRCFIAILENADEIPLGQIRFDNSPEGLVVDVSVVSSQRGRGIGRELLRQGIEQARRRWPVGTTVVAKVLKDNLQSKRLFERCGFASSGVRMFQGKAFYQLERLL